MLLTHGKRLILRGKDESILNKACLLWITKARGNRLIKNKTNLKETTIMLNKRFEVKLIEKDSSKGCCSIYMEVYHKEKLVDAVQFYGAYRDGEYVDETYFTVRQLEVQRDKDNIIFSLKGKSKEDYEKTNRLTVTSISIPYDDVTKEEYLTLRDTIFKFSRAEELVDYLSNEEKLGNKEFEQFTINDGTVTIYFNEDLGAEDCNNYLKTVEEPVSNVLNEKGYTTDRYAKISDLNDYEYKTIVLALYNTKFEFGTKTVVL